MNSKRTLLLIIAVLQVSVVAVMVAKKQSVLWCGKPVYLRTMPVDPHSLFSGDYARLSYDISRLQIADWEPKRGDTIFVELKQGQDVWEKVAVHRRFPGTVPEGHVLLKGVIEISYKSEMQKILNLQDYSEQGWLATQSSTASWRTQTFWFGEPRLVWNSGRKPEGTRVYVNVFSMGGDWQIGGVSAKPADLDDEVYPGGRRRVIIAGELGPYEKKYYCTVDYGIGTYYIPEGKGRKYEKAGLKVLLFVNGKGEAVVKKVFVEEKQEQQGGTPEVR